MLMSLTQDVAPGNQMLAGLPLEKYPDLFSNLKPVNLETNRALTFSRHVIFLNVLSLNDRRSEFSFCIRRRFCPTYH